MAEITINGVKYTNVPNKKAGTKFAASLTQSNIGASQAVQDYVNSAYFYPLVNAIDINWNGVEVDENSYINTTSDLISYIASKESNVDLSSYATMTYVNDKISEIIGGAPETLDTLKELADALEDDASLAYVTEALAGKADVNNVYTKQEVDNMIPAPVDLSGYVSYTQANSYYVAKEDIPDMNDYATVSYVTSELDKKADLSDIPSAPDLTPYVTYVDANSYYAGKNEIPDMKGYALKAETFSTKNYTNGELITSYWNPDSLVQKYYKVGFTKSRQLVFPLYAEKNWSGGGSSGSDSIFALTTSQSKYLSLIESFVFGDNNEAHHNSGNTYPLYSNILIGDHLKSNTHHTTVLGIYNNVGNYDESTTSSSFNPNDSNHSLFVIGNGKNESTRHNAFEIKRDGKIYISDTYNGTPYSLQYRLNSKANANDVYTKTEVDNMIPESTDLRNYVSYTQANSYYVSYTAANSYYMTVEGSKQLIYGSKTFIGDKRINFRQGTSNNKLGFTLYNNDEKEIGGFEWRPNTIGTKGLLSLQQYLGTGTKYTGVEMGYLGFRLTEVSSKYNLITPLPSYVNTIETINVGYDYRNFFFPLVFKNGSNKVYTDCTGLVDMTSLMPDLNDYATNSYVTTELDKKADKTELPDMTNYVTMTSYNALYEEVQHLAYLISYYHPTPDPTPTPTPTFEGYWTYNGMRTDSITVSTSDPNMTLSFVSNPTIASGIGTWNFYDMPSSGVTINSSTGEMTINPSLLSEGSVYSSVGYMYQNNGESTSFYITITVTASKQSASGNWYDSNNVMTSNKAVIAGDTTTYTFTFQSTPASGWTFSDPMMTGITVDQSNGTITIDPSGMADSAYPINITANYMEDSSYWASMVSFSIKVLPAGSNPDFYYESSSINLSNTMPSQSPMLHNSLASYDHTDYLSTDTSVATVNNYGTIEYVGPGTCTVQATAINSNSQEIATAMITVYCTQSKDMTSFQWYDSNNMSVSQYVVNLGGSGTEVFHYDATPADGWTITGDNGISILLDTALKTLTIDKSKLSIRGNNAIVAQRAEDSSYYSGMNVFNVTVIPAGESANFYFQTQGISMSPSFPSMSLMLNNNTGIDTMQYPINYSSSDTSVATVDNYGTVAYVGAGNAIITATLSDGNNSYTATATVECTSN